MSEGRASPSHQRCSDTPSAKQPHILPFHCALLHHIIDEFCSLSRCDGQPDEECTASGRHVPSVTYFDPSWLFIHGPLHRSIERWLLIQRPITTTINILKNEADVKEETSAGTSSFFVVGVMAVTNHRMTPRCKVVVRVAILQQLVEACLSHHSEDGGNGCGPSCLLCCSDRSLRSRRRLIDMMEAVREGHKASSTMTTMMMSNSRGASSQQQTRLSFKQVELLRAVAAMANAALAGQGIVVTDNDAVHTHDDDDDDQQRRRSSSSPFLSKEKEPKEPRLLSKQCSSAVPLSSASAEYLGAVTRIFSGITNCPDVASHRYGRQWFQPALLSIIEEEEEEKATPATAAPRTRQEHRKRCRDVESGNDLCYDEDEVNACDGASKATTAPTTQRRVVAVNHLDHGCPRRRRRRTLLCDHEGAVVYHIEPL